MNRQLAGRNLSGYIPAPSPLTLGAVVVLGVGAYMLYQYMKKK